ncbi:MAG: hypothetical protein ABIV43_03575, partial [Candidatus Saccharimonadales bacterium]
MRDATATSTGFSVHRWVSGRKLFVIVVGLGVLLGASQLGTTPASAAIVRTPNFVSATYNSRDCVPNSASNSGEASVT